MVPSDEVTWNLLGNMGQTDKLKLILYCPKMKVLPGDILLQRLNLCYNKICANKLFLFEEKTIINKQRMQKFNF